MVEVKQKETTVKNTETPGEFEVQQTAILKVEDEVSLSRVAEELAAAESEAKEEEAEKQAEVLLLKAAQG